MIVCKVGLLSVKHWSNHPMPLTIHALSHHFLTLISEEHAFTVALSLNPLADLYRFLRLHVNSTAIFSAVYVDFPLIEHFIVTSVPAHKGSHWNWLFICCLINKSNLWSGFFDNFLGLLFQVTLYHFFQPVKDTFFGDGTTIRLKCSNWSRMHATHFLNIL